MASEEETELTQTQSQAHTQENYLTQNGDDERDVWGILQAKHHSFTSVGMFIYCFIQRYPLITKQLIHFFNLSRLNKRKLFDWASK